MNFQGKNYSAWEINQNVFFSLSDEKEKLKHLVAYGVLAPSTHNSQPWKFSLTHNSIVIALATTRLVPIADPESRMALMSIGAAMQNIILAAQHYGYATTLRYPSYIDLSGKKPVVTLMLEKILTQPEEAEEQLFFAITKRRSNRNPFLNRIPSPELLTSIANITVGDALTHLISDKNTRATLTEEILSYRKQLFSGSDFRAELADYKRTNFTSSETGMPGFTMGFPNLLSLIAPQVIRHFNVMKLTTSKDRGLLTLHTPVMGIIASGESSRSAIAAGMTLQRALLTAEMHGLATSISAVPPASKFFQRALPNGVRPHLMFRLGFADTIPPHSPRIPVEKLLTAVPH